MIEKLNTFEEPSIERYLTEKITEYLDEVREILPELPDTIKIFFSNDFINPATGVGGFAYGKDIITVSFDKDFKNKELQLAQLRGVIFHEAYHLAHGYNAQMGKITALSEAVYEGAAGVFQRDVAKIDWVAQYGGDEEMIAWTRKVATLGEDFDWYKWKVKDEESGESVILYAVGAFIVDKALQKSNLTVLDLRHKSADEIFVLADLNLNV